MRRLAKEYKPKRDKNGQFSSTGSTGGSGGRDRPARGAASSVPDGLAEIEMTPTPRGPRDTKEKPQPIPPRPSGLEGGSNAVAATPVRSTATAPQANQFSRPRYPNAQPNPKPYRIRRDVVDAALAKPAANPTSVSAPQPAETAKPANPEKKPRGKQPKAGGDAVATAKPVKPAKKPKGKKSDAAPSQVLPVAVAEPIASVIPVGELPRAKPLGNQNAKPSIPPKTAKPVKPAKSPRAKKPTAAQPAASVPVKPATVNGLVRAKPLANTPPKTAKPVKPAKQPKAPKAEKPAAVKQPKPAKPAATAKPIKPAKPAKPQKPVTATLVKPAEKPPVIKPQPNAYGDNGGRSLAPPQAAAKPMTLGERLGNFVRNELSTISQAIGGAKKPEIVDAELVSGPPAKATPATTATAKPAEKKPAVDAVKPATVRVVQPGEASDKPVPRAKPLARAKPLVTAKPLPARPPRAAARVVTAARA